MCAVIHDVEWSGTLFYKVTGKPFTSTMRIVCVDFIVMDIGTAGFTEYMESPDIAAYMVDNDLLDCKQGLIHSHNNMAKLFINSIA